jgi:hypothetical protein
MEKQLIHRLIAIYSAGAFPVEITSSPAVSLAEPNGKVSKSNGT